MQHQLNTQQTKTARGNSILSWLVNPADPDNAFATINAAYAAADALLPAGEPVVIELAPNVVHNLVAGSIVLGAGRDVSIFPRTNVKSYFAVLGATPGTTRVVGDIALTNAAASAQRKNLLIAGLDFSGSITGEENWGINLIDVYFPSATRITRNNGAKKCTLYMQNVSNEANPFNLVDNDSFGRIMLVGCRLELGVGAGDSAFLTRGGGNFDADRCSFSMLGNGTYLHDKSSIAITVNFRSCLFDTAALAAFTLVKNPAGSTEFKNCTIVHNLFGGSGQQANIANTAFIGSKYIANGAPLNPVSGTEWLDTRTNEILTWNGTYWVVGDLVRVETLAGVGGAAADHDLGWNVPTGFAVVKASVRLLKAITGAGGATKVGFGTKAAGDPDKYALTAALTVGNPNQNLNPTYNNGSGDDLALTACDNAGAAVGTIAGSGTADARTMVWMRPPVTLAS